MRTYAQTFLMISCIEFSGNRTWTIRDARSVHIPARRKKEDHLSFFGSFFGIVFVSGGFWLSWLLWLPWLLWLLALVAFVASVAFVARGFRCFRGFWLFATSPSFFGGM